MLLLQKNAGETWDARIQYVATAWLQVLCSMEIDNMEVLGGLVVRLMLMLP